MKALPENIEGTAGAELVRSAAPERTASVRDGLPKIGEWFFVTVTDREWSEKKKDFIESNEREELRCVTHVASNHIVFTRYVPYEHSDRLDESTVRYSFTDALQFTRPAPEWKRHLEDEMARITDAIRQQTQLLYEDAMDANALPTTEQFQPRAESPFALAVRTLDPAKEKRKLMELQKKIPEVVKSIGLLAKEQAATAHNLMLSELGGLWAMQKQLRSVEDKLFTLEVYAGLQEQVKQIADGDPAPVHSKVTVRQSLLYMDEETLIDFDKGGMDFKKLRDFDEWVARPENLARILPEPRGVVAFRVRRHEKDYGVSTSLFEAWAKFEMQRQNWKTYLLLRNGQRVYRIASAVDFQPRLIPLRSEFDDAFCDVSNDYNWETHQHDRSVRRILPTDFSYDRHAEELRDNLKHYNRVVVLIQGLLDRSEVFHPHAPINLSSENDIAEWLHLVRDEEDGIGAGELSETWEQYRDRCNATLAAGDFIWHNYWDGRKRPGETYKTQHAPNIIQVKRRRKGNKGDGVPYRSSGYGQHHHVITEGRPESECVGIDGVEVEWQWEATVYRRERWRRDEDKTFTGRMWIPLTEVFNLMEYRQGDYKKFLCDRSQKGEYLKWAPQLLNAERWTRKMGAL